MTATQPENSYTTHRVPAPGGDLHAIDQPGTEPAIVLLHGFPDDWRIYRKLLYHLAPRRAVAFDFLGYGHSARPEHPDPARHEAELTAVLDTLAIDRAVLAGHDAGGPVAVNVALGHPDRVSRLVLMNTYYGTAPQLRFPEMIRLFADQNLAPSMPGVHPGRTCCPGEPPHPGPSSCRRSRAGGPGSARCGQAGPFAGGQRGEFIAPVPSRVSRSHAVTAGILSGPGDVLPGAAGRGGTGKPAPFGPETFNDSDRTGR